MSKNTDKMLPLKTHGRLYSVTQLLSNRKVSPCWVVEWYNRRQNQRQLRVTIGSIYSSGHNQRHQRHQLDWLLRLVRPFYGSRSVDPCTDVDTFIPPEENVYWLVDFFNCIALLPFFFVCFYFRGADQSTSVLSGFLVTRKDRAGRREVNIPTPSLSRRPTVFLQLCQSDRQRH